MIIIPTITTAIINMNMITKTTIIITVLPAGPK